jgi:glutathione peroxidase
MFSKISVKGSDIHPLYKYLTSKSENGYMDAPVKWNFQKFVINKEGKLVDVIMPSEKVSDKEVEKRILKHLK